MPDRIPTLDYKGPDDDAIRTPMHEAVAGALIGAGSFGCLVPLLLAVFCALVLNDMGGLLFWPIIMIFGAVVGLAAGAVAGWTVRAVRRRRADRAARPGHSGTRGTDGTQGRGG